jgi:hypothetical protein
MAGQPLSASLEKVVGDVERWCRPGIPDDDITLLVCESGTEEVQSPFLRPCCTPQKPARLAPGADSLLRPRQSAGQAARRPAVL